MGQGGRGRTDIVKTLQDAGLKPNKRYGQNFCCDPQLIDAIVRDARIRPDEAVVEVGAGTGALTHSLCQLGNPVVAFEIDSGLFRLASAALAAFPNLRLIHVDVLAGKSALSEPFLAGIRATLDETHPFLRLVANLPYAITTPLILGLFESGLPFRGASVLVQREAAERLLAPPGSKNYGVASVLLAHLATGRVARGVPPEVFHPRPKVASAVLELEVREDIDPLWRPGGAAYACLRVLVRKLFQTRRKTLAAAAKHAVKGEPLLTGLDAVVRDGNVDGRSRVENLSLDDIRGLAAPLIRGGSGGK